jgi:hypothetical protein
VGREESFITEAAYNKVELSQLLGNWFGIHDDPLLIPISRQINAIGEISAGDGQCEGAMDAGFEDVGSEKR